MDNGTRRYPLIDSDADPSADPCRAYQWLLENRPVFLAEHLPAWILSRHADVWAAFADPGLFTSTRGVAYEAPGPLPTVLELDPPAHTVARRRVARRFDRRAAARLAAQTRLLAADLAGRLAAGGDAVTDYAALLPTRLAMRVLGLPDRYADEVRAAVTGILADSHTAEMGTARITAMVNEWAAADRSGGLLADLAAGHPAMDGTAVADLLTWTLVALLGGQEPTTTAIAGLLLLLDEHPEYAPLACGDLTADVVDETLRLLSPTQYMTRTLTGDTQIAGQRLRRGERVVLLIGAANRDPAAFEAPDEFRPGARRARALSFGAGPHTCLGQWLARTLITVAVEELKVACPDLTVDRAGARWCYTGNVRQLTRLPVRPGSR